MNQDPEIDVITLGQRRRTAMGRLFTIMRISEMNHEALLRFDDRTTDWWDLDWIWSDSTPVDLGQHYLDVVTAERVLTDEDQQTIHDLLNGDDS